jgi:hypothetical protein
MGELLTGRASMVEYQFDKYQFDVNHNHGWECKEFDHEPPLLATQDKLAIIQDPESERQQAYQSIANLPWKSD